MKEVRTEIYIESTAEWVWRVLTDFESYPKWNPFIRSIERSELKTGARPKVCMQLADGKQNTFWPVLVKVVPAAQLAWRRGGLLSTFFDYEHKFEIEPSRTGVLFIQCLQFSGLLAPLLAGSVAGNMRQGCEDMNTSLKRVAQAKR